MIEKKLYILSGVLSVLILINVFFIFSFPKINTETNLNKIQGRVISDQSAYILPISEPSYIPVLNTAVEKPLLNAKSAAVYDTRSSRFLYSKNSSERLPIASLTKLLAAVIVFNNLNLDDTVHVTKSAIKVDDEKQTLYINENIKVRDLLKLMLIESSNDAAYALRDHASTLGLDLVGLMNKKAIELGMSHSIFHDPAGLNDDALSSVDDLIKLVKYSLNFTDLWSILGQKSIIVYSVDGKTVHQANSTNHLFGVVPDIVGGKTGYTDVALGNMILVVDVPQKNDKLISIVLGSKERFTDTEKLINWVKTAYTW